MRFLYSESPFPLGSSLLVHSRRGLCNTQDCMFHVTQSNKKATKAYCLAQHLLRISVIYGDPVLEVKSRVFMAMAEIHFKRFKKARMNLAIAKKLAEPLGEKEVHGIIKFTSDQLPKRKKFQNLEK